MPTKYFSFYNIWNYGFSLKFFKAAAPRLSYIFFLEVTDKSLFGGCLILKSQLTIHSSVGLANYEPLLGLVPLIDIEWISLDSIMINDLYFIVRYETVNRPAPFTLGKWAATLRLCRLFEVLRIHNGYSYIYILQCNFSNKCWLMLFLKWFISVRTWKHDTYLSVRMIMCHREWLFWRVFGWIRVWVQRKII